MQLDLGLGLIGFNRMYVSDGFLEPSAACMRAVKETAAALRADGHEVIEFDLPPIDKAFEAYLGLM